MTRLKMVLGVAALMVTIMAASAAPAAAQDLSTQIPIDVCEVIPESCQGLNEFELDPLSEGPNEFELDPLAEGLNEFELDPLAEGLNEFELDPLAEGLNEFELDPLAEGLNEFELDPLAEGLNEFELGPLSDGLNEVMQAAPAQPAADYAADYGTEDCGQPEQGYWVNKGTVNFVQSIYLTCYISGHTAQGAAIHTWTVEVRVKESRSYGYSCPSGTYWCTVRWPLQMAAGYTTGTGSIYVDYNHRLWTDTLYAKMSKYQPGVLWVSVDRVGKGYQLGAEESTQDWLTRP